MRRQAALLITSLAIAAVALMWTPGAQAHPDFSCDSCHIPHNATGDGSADAHDLVPLWNPAHSTTTITENYTSATLDGAIGAPDGASKMCLSCHDGSYDHVDNEHFFGDSGSFARVDVNNVAIDPGMGDIKDTHPISIVYAADFAAEELKDPTTLAEDVLDINSKVQCSSCHDPHATAADYGEDPFKNLHWPYKQGFGIKSGFCRNCHAK